jgi:glycosyltransferase involved in cell wall biosynthesis
LGCNYSDEPIRILAVLDDTVVSGKVKPVLAFARCAREQPAPMRKLDVSMLTFVRNQRDPEFVKMLRGEGFEVDVVRERRRFDVGVFSQLRAIVARRRPHVIWTHGAKTNFLVRIAGLHSGRVWVASHHGYTTTSLAWRLYDQLDRWSLPAADRVVTVCDAFVNDLHTRLHLKKEVLSVHRSPIAARTQPLASSAGVEARRELGLPPGSRIVLSVGRLSKEKGHADLMRAMLEVRRACGSDVVLVIVGDGPEHARLERLSRQLDLADAVRLVGYRADVVPYYAAANVFALPSYSEGSPNVLLEAMDAGVPIVATDVGGVSEMIRHGEQGWLVRGGDVDDLANGIVALLSNAELCAALSSSARRSLAAYAPSVYYAGLSALFESVLESRPCVSRS